MHASGLLATATLLAGFANAHIKLSQPVPYGKETLQLGPLKNAKPGSSGSDYPCQQRGASTYEISTMNNMKVGEQQPLSFDGSASHGGGSCQLAVSLDEKPTASSVFKLIHVFEGGCPTTAAGNGGTDNYTFTIPQDFPNGKATLAWSWYNRIGNREFYMNCAPITVSGGSDSKDFYNSLPNQYLINLPTSECSTVEGTDAQIPNVPSNMVTTNTAGTKLSPPTGPGCSAAAAAVGAAVSGGSSSSNSSSSNTTPTSSGSSSAQSSSADSSGGSSGGSSDGSSGSTSAPSPSGSGSSGSGSSSSGSGAAAPTGATGSSSPSNSSTGTSAPSGSDGSGSGSTGSDSSSSGSGSSGTSAPAPSSSSGTSSGSDGSGSSTGSDPSGSSSTGSTSSGAAMQCNGESQFGLVNPGSKIVWQAVAPGTKCVNGQIQKREPLARRHIKDIGMAFVI